MGKIADVASDQHCGNAQSYVTAVRQQIRSTPWTNIRTCSWCLVHVVTGLKVWPWTRHAASCLGQTMRASGNVLQCYRCRALEGHQPSKETVLDMTVHVRLPYRWVWYIALPRYFLGLCISRKMMSRGSGPCTVLFDKQNVKTWTGFNWLRLGHSGDFVDTLMLLQVTWSQKMSYPVS
jgi:hypothetical protein